MSLRDMLNKFVFAHLDDMISCAIYPMGPPLPDFCQGAKMQISSAQCILPGVCGGGGMGG